jgi:hypothetical protein
MQVHILSETIYESDKAMEVTSLSKQVTKFLEDKPEAKVEFFQNGTSNHVHRCVQLTAIIRY